MSVNRDGAAVEYHKGNYEQAKCLLMFEISDSLSEIVEQLRELNKEG